MIVIYHQELLQEIAFFTNQPKRAFYDDLFHVLDLSSIAEYSFKPGRNGFSNHAMICAFIVMKCEGFSQISDLHDYLSNNLIIAHFCGFDIFKPLPSYASLTRFARHLDNVLLQTIMQTQVLKAVKLCLIDTSFIALDATPIKTNVCNNNPKCFRKNKFSKEHRPKSDKDCALGIQTASNVTHNKKYDFYWGYKNHILVDCISGLPISDITTPANVADSSITLEILERTNQFLSIDECSFLADKAYDAKYIYNTVKDTYHGDCFIPLNTIISFKSVYRLRTEAERYNSRFKQLGCERVFVRNGDSVKSLNSIAHITLLAIAIATVVTKKNVSYRSTKAVKRIS